MTTHSSGLTRRAGAAAAVLTLAAGLAVTGTTTAQASADKPFELRSGLANHTLCLETAGGSSEDGALVQVSTCNGGAHQKWYWSANSEIVHAADGKCLDLPPTGASWDFRQLVVWPCHGGENQHWTDQPLANRLSIQGLNMDVYRGWTSDNTPVVAWYHGGVHPNQIWVYNPKENGTP
ncbi:RICIN domain-containing protein [Kitasatospora sp. NPDC093806]|uniref:RICIN domain-containing protein n=1 Tax=Kitasatospora sp. NPDC093806 TaxID=3155075 RepID=UPI0034292AFA